VIAAMGLSAAATPDSCAALAAVGPAALVRSGARLGRDAGLQHQSQQGEGANGATGPGGRGGAGNAGPSSSRPELQPSWLGFRAANPAATRWMQQQQQQQQQQPGQAAAGAAGGAGAGGGGAAGAVDGSGSAPAPTIPFVPYAPPPLQGIVNMTMPGLQVRLGA
jgi:hypothetical protein